MLTKPKTYIPTDVADAEAIIAWASQRIGNVPPVCHLAWDGSRPQRYYDEMWGTRIEYTDC